MRIAVLASAGKDSTYAAWWAHMQGWEVCALVTVWVTGKDSMMFQLPETPLAGLQAAASGVAWLPVLSDGCEDNEIDDLEAALAGRSDPQVAYDVIRAQNPHIEFPDTLELLDPPLQIDALVVGAIRSDYQKTRIERLCDRLGIISYCPLWHHSSDEHMTSLIEHGFDVRIVSVSADGLDSQWLGVSLNEDRLTALREAAETHRFNLDGEGGEFETIVLAAPHLSGRIVTEGETHWRGSRGTWKLTSARLESLR